MAKPKLEKSYLSHSDSEADLDNLDAAYCAREGSKPLICHKLGADSIRLHWGVANKRNLALLDYVGVRGRIWAICLLLARYDDRMSNDAAVAHEIIRHAKSVESPVITQLVDRLAALDKIRPTASADSHHAPVKDLGKFLQRFISQTSKEGFAPAETTDRWLDLVLEYATAALCSRSAKPELAKQAFHAAAMIETAHAPSDVYRALREQAAAHAGEPNVRITAQLQRAIAPTASLEELKVGMPWKAKLSRVEGSLRVQVMDDEDNYVLPGELDGGDKNIQDIRAKLRGPARLIVVGGEPLLGKKTKVKGLLRLLASSGALLLKTYDNSDRVSDYLPVLALSAADGNYRHLVDRVAAFLDDYDSAAENNDYSRTNARVRSGRTKPTRRQPTEQFAEAVENIFALYQSLPALFIITDVQAFEFDRTRQAVRDSGIRRLIEAILAANDENRIVITTNDELQNEKQLDYLARPREIALITIDAPTLHELEEFVHPTSWRLIQEDRFDPIDASFRGDDMVAFAAFISLASHPSAGASHHLQQSDYGPEGVLGAMLARPRGERDDVRVALYKRLVEEVRRRKLLHPLALVAASHDGVRDDSLVQLLEEWRADGEKVELPDKSEPITVILEAFRDIAGIRFLRRSTIPRYDPDEYGPGESHAATDQVWDMDPLVGYWFLMAAAEAEPQGAELVAASHRLIARIARRRAQTKKVQMRAALGSRVTEDASRDIQSYESLLASIRFDWSKEHEFGGMPLRCMEDDIFSVKAGKFNPAHALRFAAYSLLKEDVDHDYRLTMIFDEDALRLDLYMLLFLDLGRPHPTKLERLTLPNTLPAHLLAGIFDDSEVLDLMSTVALSAFHAQRFPIVQAVDRLAKEFIQKKKITERLPARMARLWCSIIDSRILLGGPFGGGGHKKTLAALQEMKESYFQGIGNEANQILACDMPMDELKSYMRLLAREAELKGLIEADGKAASTSYATLMALESALSRHSGQHDPVVMSGRVARRYIRFLLSDAQRRSQAEGVDVLIQARETIRGLVSVNTSRLRRFSGAERVGVMLDRARLALLDAEIARANKEALGVEGYLKAARDYTDAANRRAFSGSVSHASKLDVLAVQSEANCRLVEAILDGLVEDAEAADLALEWAGVAAHDLAKMADSLGARPALGLARLLEAQALIAEYRLCQRGISYGGKRADNPLRAARQKLGDAKRIMLKIDDRSIEDRVTRAATLLEQDPDRSQD